jgi:hypothetical protein
MTPTTIKPSMIFFIWLLLSLPQQKAEPEAERLFPPIGSSDSLDRLSQSCPTTPPLDEA